MIMLNKKFSLSLSCMLMIQLFCNFNDPNITEETLNEELKIGINTRV